MNEVPVSATSSDDRNFAMLAHLLGIFTYPFGSLVIWLIKKDDSEFIAQEALEALNFQITLLICHAIAGLLIFVLIGLLFIPILAVINVIFSLIGAVTAAKGEAYRYPFAIRLVS
jgi:uncharacterized Tic20 family protein